MINIEQLKKNYAAMDDERLIHFAKTEKSGLTKDARTVLLKEFEDRGLDLTILEPSGPELNYDKERHWFFALEEKSKGSSNDIIFSKLIARNIAEEQAALIIRRLPETDYSDEAFEYFITNKCETSVFAGNLVRIIYIGLCALCIAYGASRSSLPTVLAGILLMVPGIYFFIRSHFYGGKFWIKKIKYSPENIVWIKPIAVKHKAWYIITLYKTYHFQIRSRDNSFITIDCNGDVNQKIFLEGIKKYLPHAHIGYSLDIQEMYERSPEDFINALQYEHEYVSVSEIE